jgi:hypothetical protein
VVAARDQIIEFGDFQTPDALALSVCRKLHEVGIRPDIVIEPTCGIGAFVAAAAQVFSTARSIHGFEINKSHLEILAKRVPELPGPERIGLHNKDFFATEWEPILAALPGHKLILGNLPWVTNSTIGAIGGANLPRKNSARGLSGMDALMGKSNFDISESMLVDILRWVADTGGDVAMLIKTSVARKILAHAEKTGQPIKEAYIVSIDAKQAFNVAVDACLLVVRVSSGWMPPTYDYTVFTNMDDAVGRQVGHRGGLTVRDLATFESNKHLIGSSPQRWRSGVKHDASSVMELTLTDEGLRNGYGEVVDIEETHLFPLMKGSDVGAGRQWRKKYLLVTQTKVGAETAPIQAVAPKTWAYLEKHRSTLDGRSSSVYVNKPKYSIFGVGDYAFRPWKIAICSLYKTLRFGIYGPIEGEPVQFDDTVYYVSFESEADAKLAHEKITSDQGIKLLDSIIFWDEKRPIKSGILNLLDWERV